MVLIPNFFKIIGKIFWIIKKYPKKYLIFALIIFTIITSFTEVLTLGSLLPLIDVLLHTSKYLSNENFTSIIEFLNIDNENLKIFLLIIFGVLLIISYLFKMFLTWIASHVTHDISYYINNQIFVKTIRQDYKYFTNTNSSVFLGNLEKAEHARGATFSLIQLLISIIIASSIIIFVFFLNFEVTFTFTAIFAFIYFLIFIFLKKKITNISILNSKVINSRYLKFCIFLLF